MAKRKNNVPGVYDRGSYFQVKIRWTDTATGDRMRLRSVRYPYLSKNAPDRVRALREAEAYAAAEWAALHRVGKPHAYIVEGQTLSEWLERWRRDALDRVDENGTALEPLPPARKGDVQERSIVRVLLSRHLIFARVKL